MLLAPLIHIVALELARPQLLGPTVGALRLNDVYGVLAFVLGRGLYGLVAIVPLILGAYLGATLTPDQAVSDTIELTNELRQRFDEQKIYVLGESWGSMLGVLAVQRQPDLFYAFIGSGQMVSVRETDQRFYQDVLDRAARNGDEQLAAKLRSYGQPPYADTPYANVFAMGQYDALYKPYTPSQAYQDLGNAAGIGPYGVLASEYNLVEKFNVLRGLLDTFTVLYPQLQEIDFRRDVKQLAVPVYVLDGTAELAARRDLTHEWFDALAAPTKRMFRLENATHSVAFEQFEAFGTIMRKTVLPATYQAR